MVGIEIAGKIGPDILAQTLFHKRQVLLEMFRSKCSFQKFPEPPGNVVFEPVFVENRDDVVFVGGKSG